MMNQDIEAKVNTNGDLQEEVLGMLNTLEGVALSLNNRGLEHMTNRGTLVSAWARLRELKDELGHKDNQAPRRI